LNDWRVLRRRPRRHGDVRRIAAVDRYPFERQLRVVSNLGDDVEETPRVQRARSANGQADGSQQTAGSEPFESACVHDVFSEGTPSRERI
jgi:hypothetical protein